MCWSFSRNAADDPRARSSLSAVSGVIARFPLKISLSRAGRNLDVLREVELSLAERLEQVVQEEIAGRCLGMAGAFQNAPGGIGATKKPFGSVYPARVARVPCAGSPWLM